MNKLTTIRLYQTVTIYYIGTRLVNDLKWLKIDVGIYVTSVQFVFRITEQSRIEKIYLCRYVAFIQI